MVTPRKPPGQKKRGGRPLKHPAELARAIELVEGGMVPADAIQHPDVKGRVKQRTLYDAIDRKNGKPARPRPRAKKPSPVAAEPSTEKPEASSPSPPPAPIVAEKPPEGLDPSQLQRWIIERQIDAVRTALALAESKIAAGDTSALSRIGPLNTQLREWLGELSQLNKAGAAADPRAEERRWEVAVKSATSKIRAGVQKARERMAALLGRPFPADAVMGARR